MKRLEIQVNGRVQGVGFRQYTVERARRYGVSGWVRNERDGSVRVDAEGEDHAVDALLRDLKEGPSLARVRDVHVQQKEASGDLHSFSVKY